MPDMSDAVSVHLGSQSPNHKAYIQFMPHFRYRIFTP